MLIRRFNKNTAAIVILLALSLACLSTGIPAQQQETKTSPKPAQKKTSDKGTGKADFVKAGWGSNKTTLMKGNVNFTHGDTVLTSDRVDYDEEASIAKSPGKVNIADPECDISGDKGTAYFRKKLGVVEGSVSMLLKPKKTEQEKTDKESASVSFKKPTTITCSKLEYLYKAKIATATGSVVFKQEKHTATADKAVYDQKKELLTLTGNVKGIDDEGQTFSAPGTVTISLKKGDEWMEAPNASVTFKIDLDEDEEEVKQ